MTPTRGAVIGSVFGDYLSVPQVSHSGPSVAPWNEHGCQASALWDRKQKDRAMPVFEIFGGVFVLLFLAAAMSGIEGAEDPAE
jgi:hypothetical protein